MKKMKLSLNKEVIANLQNNELNEIKGGTKDTYTWIQSCYGTCPATACQYTDQVGCVPVSTHCGTLGC